MASVNHAPATVRGPCQLNDAPMRRALDPERCIASSTGCIIKSPARARLDGSGSKQRPTKSRMIDVVDGAGAPTASTPSCQHAAKQSIATATTRADSRNNQPRTEVIQAARVAAQHVNNCVAGHHGVLAATNTHTHTGRIEEAAALWYSRSVPRLQISAAGVNVPLSRSSGASYISAELSVLAGDWHQRIHTTHVSEAQVHTRADK